ncbi:MAG TPA: ammonia channel protein, partial [Gammaproteobacteria bacterium]
FGVHGIGGIIGALLTGVFVSEALGGSGLAEGMSIGGQLWIQFYAVLATVLYDAIVTFVILKVIDALIGLRVNEEQETEGLDVALHGERGYTL